jgi:hypothetical protein
MSTRSEVAITRGTSQGITQGGQGGPGAGGGEPVPGCGGTRCGEMIFWGFVFKEHRARRNEIVS